MAGGWKVACHSDRMIEQCRVTSPGPLVWECEIRTWDHNCKRMPLFLPLLLLHVCTSSPTYLKWHLIQLYVFGRELSLTLAK